MKLFVILFLFIGLSAHAHHKEGKPTVKHSIEATLEGLEDFLVSRIENLYSTSLHYNNDTFGTADLEDLLENLELLRQVRTAIHFNQCKGPVSVGIAINVKGKVEFRHLESGTETVSFYQGPQILTIGEKGTRITVSKDATLHLANIGDGTLKLKDPKTASTVSYGQGKSVTLTNGEIDLFFE